MVNSDAGLDPQAYILTPRSAIAIAQAIVSSPDDYTAGKNAALAAIALLAEGHKNGLVKISELELPWLDTMRETVEELPAAEGEFIDQMMGTVDTEKFVPKDYAL